MSDISQRETFERDGYLVVKNFASKEECQEMKNEMKRLVNDWDGKCECSFATDENQLAAQGKSDYFLSSADKIHFFLEKEAINEHGNIKDGISKHISLNKVGHGLHVMNPIFRAYANSDKVLKLTRELGWVKPVLPQSMYIFKNPGIGGEVTSHQDSTFLFTTPRQTCLGLWLALDDATLDNGCLWARPGSHKEGIRRHFIRNPEHFKNGNKDASQMVFVDVTSPKEGEGEMEGKNFESGSDPRDKGFVPVPIKAGDLFVIHGAIDHMSLPNISPLPRETFQLHLVEGPDEGITWSPDNWLQYPKDKTFPLLGSA